MTIEPGRFYQAWQAPNGKIHATRLWVNNEPAAFCREWWPRVGWSRVADDTPITCGSCLHSRSNVIGTELVRGR